LPLNHCSDHSADAHAHLRQTANDRGGPVYVRCPDGVEVRGHSSKFTVRTRPARTPRACLQNWFREPDGEDVEGHGIIKPPDLIPQRLRGTHPGTAPLGRFLRTPLLGAAKFLKHFQKLGRNRNDENPFDTTCFQELLWLRGDIRCACIIIPWCMRPSDTRGVWQST